jgi:hypothetical protein
VTEKKNEHTHWNTQDWLLTSTVQTGGTQSETAIDSQLDFKSAVRHTEHQASLARANLSITDLSTKMLLFWS